MNTVPRVGAEHMVEPGAFHRRLASLFAVGFALEPTESAPFFAELDAWSLGGLHLAQATFSAHKTRRMPLPGTNSREYFLINWQLEGRVFVTQDGRESEIPPGDMYVINTSRNFMLETEALRVRSVYIPADRFRAAYPEIDSCVATRLSATRGVGKLVAETLSGAFAVAHELEARAADRLAEALPYLIAAALEGREHRDAVCPSRCSLYHRERVKAFVRTNLRNPQLSCDMIAKALRLSQRYIYDLFANEPLTLMRWMWGERMERCHRELGMPALRGRSVGEIALSWGFVNLAHFSRAFSQEYGVSPREFRKKVFAEGAAGNASVATADFDRAAEPRAARVSRSRAARFATATADKTERTHAQLAARSAG